MTSEHETVDSVPSDCSTQFEDQVIYSFDEDQAWIEWEEFVEVINPVAASVPIEKHPPSSDSQGTPMMPCTHFVKDDHRERLGSSLMGSIVGSALVARPVGRKEMLNDPEALESMMKEWKGQWSAGVYDFKVVREYDDVLKEASNKGEEIHMARVHGICVEKHSELPKEDKRRKFKGRGVLLGNQVKNQNLEAAFFQDLGNSPASFESSRWADMFGCLPGHNVQLADAIQAYIQAPLSGVACWVELPDEAWPPQIEKRKYSEITQSLIRTPRCGNYVGETLRYCCKEARVCPHRAQLAVNVSLRETKFASGSVCRRFKVGRTFWESVTRLGNVTKSSKH